MAQLETVLIKDPDLQLEVSGYFEKGEPKTWDHPGTGDSFEITDLKIVKGEPIDLLFWLDGKKNCVEYVEELCIQYLNEYY